MNNDRIVFDNMGGAFLAPAPRRLPRSLRQQMVDHLEHGTITGALAEGFRRKLAEDDRARAADMA
jgi:hypothetical protein